MSESTNEKYFLGRPPIDNLVFSITPDSNVRFQKLKVGECHLIIDPSPQDLDGISKNANLKLKEREGINIGYVTFNTTKKPFDQLKVRQAIAHALNRASYITAIFMGRATLAINPIPPTIWSYNNEVKDYEYNIEKAKALLKEAGFPNGFETELWTMPVSRPYNPAGRKMGELMKVDNH